MVKAYISEYCNALNQAVHLIHPTFFLNLQLRNEYDGISPDPGGVDRGFPGTRGPSRSEESCGNLQHISEREPDDWEQDPSLHPTRETLFMEKTKKSIQSK